MKESLDGVPLAPKKRELLKLSAIAGGSAIVGTRALDAYGKEVKPPHTTPFVEELPVYLPKSETNNISPTPQQYAHPDEAGRDPHQGWLHWPYKKTYVVNVQEGNHWFHRELPRAKIWGYDGIYPGPTFVARVGEPIIVRFYNRLLPDVTGFGSPEISTHLHNGHSASESDGFAGNYFSATKAGPTLSRPGLFYDYHYPNCYAGYDKHPDTDGDPNEGLGTMWYHDHRENFTAPNVYKGLAGFYLIFDKLDSGNENDTDANALRLPSGVGVYDIPLILQDPKFDSGGRHVFNQFDTDGFIGNKFAVNGKIQPFYQVARRKYRFRLLNGSTARFYDCQLMLNGTVKPFQLIANDGNLLPAPLTLTSFRIAPAQRLDIIVDFAGINLGSKLFLVDRIIQLKGRGPELLMSPTGTPLMRFDVEADAPDNSRVPAALRPLTPVNLRDVVQKRHFEFERENGVWLVNGREFRVDNPAFKVKRGTAEIWTLEGKGSWHHPIHVHMEEGRILTRNGKPPAAYEAGRLDMFNLNPGDVLRVFMRFRDFTGKYMMHCHNTIHEDHAMMLRFDVED